MKKKEGFTLVELLAVLVILAIISLITVPIVLRVINNTSNESYKRDIEGFAEAAENGIADWQMLNPGKDYSKYDFSNINTKGDKVTCDYKYAYKDGSIALGCCYTDGSRSKNIYYDYIDKEVKQTDVCAPLVYNVFDDVTLKGELYHIIGENDDYFIALKDLPITIDEINEYGA